MASAWHWLKVSPLPPENDCAISIDSSSTSDLSTSTCSSDETETKSISSAPRFFTVYYTPNENNPKAHIPIFPTSDTSLGNVIPYVHTNNKTVKVDNGFEATTTNRSWIKAVKRYFSQHVVHNSVNAMERGMLGEKECQTPPEKVFIVSENASNEQEQESVESSQHDASDHEVRIPKYLDHMLQLMYYLGLSTFHPNNDRTNSANWRQKCLVILQKMMFFLVALLALFHSLSLMKLNWLIFVEKGGIINFVDVGFWLIPVVMELYVFYLFGFRHEQIKDMLTDLCSFGNAWFEHTTGNKAPKTRVQGKRRANNKVYRNITFLVIASVLICLCKTGAEDGIQDWSMKNKLLTKSRDLSHGIFMWNTDDVFDGNRTQHFREEYGTNLTPLTIAMSIIMSLIEFCSNLKIEMMINLVLVTGYCLKDTIGRQAARIKKIDFSAYCADGNDSAKLHSPDGLWADYQKLKKANKAINKLFDGVLKFLHLYNIIQCTYFMMHLLDNKVTSMEFVLLLYNILKLSFAYYIAKQSHSYNPVFEQWIRDWAMHSNDAKFLARIPAMLDEVKSEPLGLGTGEFIIGETFILKFVGLVGSMVMLQLDDGK